MRGLPYDVTEKDIINFFLPYNVAAGEVKIGLNGSRQRTGEAVVQFKSAEDARKAETEKDGNNIGSRWIELYLITVAQYKSFEVYAFAERSMSQKPTTNMKSYLTKENRQNALRLRGLPFNVTEEDIMNFFKNYHIVGRSNA